MIEKSTRVDLGLWMGYRLRNNLGIGLDFYYQGVHKYFERSYTNTLSYYWKYIAKDNLRIGPSVTWKPFPILVISYNLTFLIKQRVEESKYRQKSLTNIINFIKLKFFLIQDKLILNIDFEATLGVGPDYELLDPVNPLDVTWIKDTYISTNLSIDYWFLKHKLYFRAGGFFKWIVSRYTSAKRSLFRPHDIHYRWMYGMQFGVGYKLNKYFKFTLDFVYQYFKYLKSTSYNMEVFTPYSTYSVIFSLRIKL